jgi:hypothetical protein
MTETPQQLRGQSTLERWVQHIMQALTIAAILGGYQYAIDLQLSLFEMKTSMAVQKAEMISVREKLIDIKVLGVAAYSNAEARAAHQSMYDIFADHENRIRLLERPNK